MKVYCISDVHIDYKENWQWCQDLSDDLYQDDILIVAGDITHYVDKLKAFFLLLKSKFKEVFFVPGNHDLWLTTSDKEKSGLNTSIDKFHALLQLCKAAGVHTEPKKVGSTKPVWIVPLFSWYHESFDNDPATAGEKIESWNDFVLWYYLLILDLGLRILTAEDSVWPPDLVEGTKSPSCPIGTPWRYFLQQNESRVNAKYDAPVISFSHFLPRRDCLPPKKFLFIPYLPKVVGLVELDDQIRKLGSKVHGFGHTHILWNKVLDGIHYVQRALKYPRERATFPQYSTDTLLDMVVWDEAMPGENCQAMLAEREAKHLASFSGAAAKPPPFEASTK